MAPALPPTSPSSRPPGKPPPAGSAPSDAERPHPSWAPRASVLRACLRRTREAGMQEEPSGNYVPGVTPHDSLTTLHNLWVWDWLDWGVRKFFLSQFFRVRPPAPPYPPSASQSCIFDYVVSLRLVGTQWIRALPRRPPRRGDAAGVYARSNRHWNSASSQVLWPQWASKKWRSSFAA